jgi:UDP-glucose 4-epimerase
MHILVTGGNGFIGSHLVDRLVSTGKHHVVVIDLYPRSYEPLPDGVIFIPGNLNDNSLVRHTLVDQGIDVIYHLAWATIHETSLRNPVSDIRQDLIPTVSLLDTCREARVNRVIFISSGGVVYGPTDDLPIKETHPTNPINAYGITKLAVEKYLRMYQHLYGLDFTIFRPSVPYGPRQNPRRRQGAVSVFIYKIMRQESIQIWGDGQTLRDYFYIEDLVEALASALDIPDSINQVINLGGSRGYSLNQLVSLIEETLGLEANIEYQSSREFDVQRLNLDLEKAKSILNWSPHTSLPEGIRSTAAWINRWID